MSWDKKASKSPHNIQYTIKLKSLSRVQKIQTSDDLISIDGFFGIDFMLIPETAIEEAKFNIGFLEFEWRFYKKKNCFSLLKEMKNEKKIVVLL